MKRFLTRRNEFSRGSLLDGLMSIENFFQLGPEKRSQPKTCFMTWRREKNWKWRQKQKFFNTSRFVGMWNVLQQWRKDMARGRGEKLLPPVFCQRKPEKSCKWKMSLWFRWSKPSSCGWAGESISLIAFSASLSLPSIRLILLSPAHRSFVSCFSHSVNAVDSRRTWRQILNINLSSNKGI